MRLFSHIAAILALAIFVAQPAAAQSILRDAETEAFLDDISEPLIEAAGLQPNNVDVILINDPSINAFVAGGQAVYIHSGLIDAADTANEVQGVIAHELGHVTGGHVIRIGEGYQTAANISILSLLAGIGAALAKRLAAEASRSRRCRRGSEWGGSFTTNVPRRPRPSSAPSDSNSR